MFFGPIGKKWPPKPLIGWDIFDFFSETDEQNSTKLDRKQDLNILYQVCVFQAGRKNKMSALASDWLRHFGLLLWNRWKEFNETWQEGRYQCPLQSLGFWADWKNKMAALASDWLRHFWLLLWTRWTEFNQTWQEARSKRLLPSLCYLGRSQKQDGRPGLRLAETFSTSSLKSLNRIQRNLTGSKLLTSSTKFVSYGPIWKTRWPPWPLIGWNIFDFSDETTERNSKKLDRKQDLKVLYQVCVFRADRKNKMASPASDWLRHFRLLLWNRWTKFNRTWQERRSQCPLPSLCFSGRSENKIASPASDWLRYFRLHLWNRWTELHETWQEARSSLLLPSLHFLGCSEKQDGLPSLWLTETFLTSSLKPLNRIRRNLTGSKISMSFTKSVFFGPIGKKKDGHHGPWLAETFLSSPLKLLNGIQRNLTGSKISTSSTKMCFSVWWVNKNYRPGQSIKKGHIVLRCTICGPLGLLFMYLFRCRKGGGLH